MSKYKIIGCYQDTRNNKEDFALTPYLFSVYFKGGIIKIFGVGICWGYYSFSINIGKNMPKSAKMFLKL